MTLSDYMKQALIGLFLGDLFASRKTPDSDTVLAFDQTSNGHSAYLLWLYSIFEPFVGLPPLSTNRKPDSRTGKIYNSLRFQTLAFPCFNLFYDLFYPNGVKIVPLTIAELLTPVGLAFWICDDGSKSHYGVLLHTDSYTLDEVTLLINVLKSNFGLNCRCQLKRPGQWNIVIPNRELTKLQALVSQYMHSSMLYKIGL
jgi:hypothetical protein